MEEPTRRLERSRDDRVIAGVCGGIGRYLDVDPVLVRIAFVVLVVFGGSGILAYLVGWIAMPDGRRDAPADAAAGRDGDVTTGGRTGLVLGALLVALGTFILLDQFVPGVRRGLGPVLLIALGVALVVGRRR